MSRMPSSDSVSTVVKLTRRESGGAKDVHPKLEYLQEFNMGNVSYRSDSISSVRVKNKVYTLVEPEEV